MKKAHQLAAELLNLPDLPIYHFDPSQAGTDEERDTSVSVPKIEPGGEKGEFLTICGQGTEEDEAVSDSEMDLRIKVRDGVLEPALRILNEAFAADPAAVFALVEHRVPCSDALANHPTIQCGTVPHPLSPEAAAYVVGMLGIVNGIIEATTGERIAVVIGDDGRCEGFKRYSPPSA